MNNNYEYYCPYKDKVIEEEMYFGQTLHYLYGTYSGRFLLVTIFKRIWWGIFYRLYKKSSLSIKSIDRDIERFNLNMNEYIIEDWKSYNHFFMRKFKDKMRTFVNDESLLQAFAEGKYLVYESDKTSTICIKGEKLEIKNLLNTDEFDFKEAYLLVARLCPTDYHHYHYPCNGTILKTSLVRGSYDSVNIFAQDYRPNILFKNKRWVSVLKTIFGKIAYIEVGGMSVATIVNEHKAGDMFSVGEHKGHFEYGGSSIILIISKKNFTLREDILLHSKEGRETYLKLGDKLGHLTK